MKLFFAGLLLATPLLCAAAGATPLSQLASSWADSIGRPLRWMSSRDLLVGPWRAPAPTSPTEIARAFDDMGKALASAPLILCELPDGALAASERPVDGCRLVKAAPPAQPIPEGDPQGSYAAREVPPSSPPKIETPQASSPASGSFIGAPFNPGR